MLIMYIIYHDIIWACIISAIIGVSAILLYFYLRSRKKKQFDDLKPSPKRDILIGLRDNAEYFAHLYEPTYILASGRVGRKDDVFDAWNDAVGFLEGYEGFKSAFAKKFGNVASWKGKNRKYVSKADKLLSFIFKAGIFRDDKMIITADETTAEKYDLAGCQSIETAAMYDVLAPYWYRNVVNKSYSVVEDVQLDTSTQNIVEPLVEADEQVENISEEKLTRKEKKHNKKEAKKVKKANKKAANKQRKEDKRLAKLENLQSNRNDTAVAEEVILSKGVIR